MKTKTCSKCGVEKGPGGFYKHPAGKNGLDSRCKECVKEAAKIRNKKASVKEKNKLRQRQYYRDLTPEKKEKRKKQMSLYRKTPIALKKDRERNKRRYEDTEYRRQQIQRSVSRNKREDIIKRRINTTNYMKKLLILQSNDSLKASEIPQRLIALKRQSIKLKRLIKQKKDD